MDELRSSSAPVSVASQGRPRRAFQVSTFHRLSSFILRNTAGFTTPSVVMVFMLPVRAWCPKYQSNIQLWLHSTCNCSCYRRAADRFSKLCNGLLLSTSRVSHFSRQAISSNPEETDRICCHCRYPPQDGVGRNDLSHMRFQSKFQSSRLPLHLKHD